MFLSFENDKKKIFKWALKDIMNHVPPRNSFKKEILRHARYSEYNTVKCILYLRHLFFSFLSIAILLSPVKYYNFYLYTLKKKNSIFIKIHYYYYFLWKFFFSDPQL